MTTDTSGDAVEVPVAVDGPVPNPWRSMWFSPRATVRRLVELEIRPSWVPVVVLAAVGTALTAMQLDDDGAPSFSRSLAPVAMGVFRLVFDVLVGPFILAIVGGWFGNDTDATDVREAVAWSHVPVAVGSVFWAIGAVLIGTVAWDASDEFEIESAWDAFGILLQIIAMVCYLWSLPALIGALAGAMRVSIGKALLFTLVVSLPALLLVMIR